MNPGDKAMLKAQLSGLAAQLGATSTLATSGASMPINTPMGPAAAPGLMQIGAAVQQQVAVTQNLMALLTKLIDLV